MPRPERRVIFSTPGPVALAHRGGAAEAPENSRAAIEHTLELGYRYLETDVHLTADGVVVLMHDPELDRTTNGSGYVRDHTWQQLQQLRDGSGEPPVRLRDVLTDFPQLRLNIDLKEDRVVAPAMREITAAGAWSRVCIASFSDARLRVVRAMTTGRVATSLGRREAFRLVLASRSPRGVWRRLRLPGPAAASTPGATALQVPPSYRGRPVLTARLIELAHARGLHVHAWTIDDPTQMHELLDLGVDGLVTDRPTVLRRVLQERGQWHAGDD
ncbi:MAG TPA: glycerophosphodiester phosphodiesterase [Actinomycetaceae bacterium]|nr:glycerophosphodiester phosphodiesterase [Actinomycetaceae bacterium]